MNLTTLAIILIVVGLLEIFGFMTALLLLKNKLEKFRLERDQFCNNYLRNYALSRSDEKERDEKQWKLLSEMAQQADILKEQYEAIDAAYDVMNERYQAITDNYKKLLDAWEKVEERYSDCYDQLKYQNEQFEKFEKFYMDPHFIQVDVPGEFQPCAGADEEGKCVFVSCLHWGEPCIGPKCSCYTRGSDRRKCKWRIYGDCTNVASGAFARACTADPADCPYSGMSDDGTEA